MKPATDATGNSSATSLNPDPPITDEHRSCSHGRRETRLPKTASVRWSSTIPASRMRLSTSSTTAWPKSGRASVRRYRLSRMKTILHAVHIHAAPPKVYEALTTASGLAGWWSKEGVRIDESGVVHFTFAGDFHPQMKQTRLDPPRRVEWRCVGGHPNWQDNTFSFTLNERKGETLVQFVQEYAQELSDEVYGTYNFNWGYYLNSLKMLCEKGTGAP